MGINFTIGIFCPSSGKDMQKKLKMTKSDYNKLILPVTLGPLLYQGPTV